MTEGIERHAIALLEPLDLITDVHDHPRGFMTQHHRQARCEALGAEFPFVDMEVGPADAARRHLDQQLAAAGARDWNLDQFGAEFGARLRDGFHLIPCPPVPCSMLNTTAGNWRQTARSSNDPPGPVPELTLSPNSGLAACT